MADLGNSRGPLETLALAGLGAVALAADRADDLADEIATRLGLERDDVRTAVGDVLESWRREAGRLGEQTSEAASRIAEELGIASSEVVDDLALRVAQLEHRLKLLERSMRGPPSP
jgi:polyhydroxyalkanoate synthesis regulator phasin